MEVPLQVTSNKHAIQSPYCSNIGAVAIWNRTQNSRGRGSFTPSGHKSKRMPRCKAGVDVDQSVNATSSASSKHGAARSLRDKMGCNPGHAMSSEASSQAMLRSWAAE